METIKCDPARLLLEKMRALMISLVEGTGRRKRKRQRGIKRGKKEIRRKQTPMEKRSFPGLETRQSRLSYQKGECTRNS